MSAPAKSRLAKLAAMPDSEINFGDIPPSSRGHAAVWTRPGIPFSSENKQQVTLRLDADVLDFFRASGKRYQTRINSVLREYMRDQAKLRGMRSGRK